MLILKSNYSFTSTSNSNFNTWEFFNISENLGYFSTILILNKYYRFSIELKLGEYGSYTSTLKYISSNQFFTILVV